MDEQTLLFEIAKSKLPDRQRLSDILGELLDIGADSAYRRIRGETELSFSELIKICTRFNLSMDEILNLKSNRGIVFQYEPTEFPDQDSYISQLQHMLKVLTALRSAADAEMVYVARSIPLYHLLPHPQLAFLNLYAWNSALNPSDGASFEHFCSRLDQKRIISLYRQLHRACMLVPSKEIWNVQTVGATLRALEYYVEAGLVEKKDTALHLLEQLGGLVDSVGNYANQGLKGDDRQTSFWMYNCSVDLDKNTVLIKKGKQLTYYIRFNTMNFLQTENDIVCHAAQKLNADLMAKSTLISGNSAARKRHRFFQTAKHKIEESVEKIQSGAGN